MKLTTVLNCTARSKERKQASSQQDLSVEPVANKNASTDKCRRWRDQTRVKEPEKLWESNRLSSQLRRLRKKFGPLSDEVIEQVRREAKMHTEKRLMAQPEAVRGGRSMYASAAEREQERKELAELEAFGPKTLLVNRARANRAASAEAKAQIKAEAKAKQEAEARAKAQRRVLQETQSIRRPMVSQAFARVGGQTPAWVTLKPVHLHSYVAQTALPTPSAAAAVSSIPSLVASPSLSPMLSNLPSTSATVAPARDTARNELIREVQLDIFGPSPVNSPSHSTPKSVDVAELDGQLPRQILGQPFDRAPAHLHSVSFGDAFYRKVDDVNSRIFDSP